MTSNSLTRLGIYGSSDSDSDGATSPDNTVHDILRPDAKKRKIPPLNDGSAMNFENEKKPVQGEWLCYCFVEITITDRLHSLIQEAHATIKSLLSAASHFTGQDDTTRLHISLTRPITVRAHERDDFVREASSVAHSAKSNFSVAFSRFANLQNDDASRDFLVLEIGMGRDRLHELSAALGKKLHQAFRAQQYYQEARFHTSTGHLALSNVAGNSNMATDTLSEAVKLLEVKLGNRLRASAPVAASRLGIQVGTSIYYLDL